MVKANEQLIQVMSNLTEEVGKLNGSFSGFSSSLKETVENMKKKGEQNISKNEGEKKEKDFEKYTNGFIGVLDKVVSGIQAGYKAYYDIQKTNIKAEKDVMSKRMEVYGNALKKASETTVEILTGNITEAAFGALRNNLDFGLSEINRRIEAKQIEYDRQLQNRITNLQAENALIDSATGTISGVASLFGTIGSAIGGIVSFAGSIAKAENEIEIQQLQAKQERVHMMNELQQKVNEQAFALAEPMIKLGQGIDKMLLELDKSAHELARSFGYGTEATIEYKQAMIEANKEMAMLGKTWQDLTKSQQSYIEASDRNRMLSGLEGLQTSAIGTLFGIGDAESGAIMGAMNLFNKSIEDGSDMMFNMYKTANKMGVSNQKFAKDLQSTLKLAQRYQFKDGVKGVMDMALWSQKVRLNMDEVGSALSKMHTGNIEDIIKTSAGLNVLGGNAALYSNPFNMLFNAYADPKKYMENINNMISGMGTINATSGETSFSIAEQMRIEQIANQVGMSAESLMNQARQANKSEAIRRRFGNRFGDYTDYITQNALWDEESGTWKANVLRNGEVKSVKLEDIKEEDFANIFPEDNQEKLITYVSNILSIMERQSRTEETMHSILMGETAQKHEETHDYINNKTLEEFKDNIKWYKDNVLDVFSSLQQAMENQFMMNERMRISYEASEETMIKVVNGIATKAFQESINSFEEMLLYFTHPENFENIFNMLKKSAFTHAMENGGVFTNEDYKRMLNNINTKYGDYAGQIFEKVYKKDFEDMISYHEQYIADAPKRQAEENAKAMAQGAGYNAMGYSDKDVILTPEGPHYTDPNDLIMAFKPGGPIAQGLGANNMGYSQTKIEVSGTLRLESGNQSIDILKIAKENPNFTKEITEMVITRAYENKYGGRSLHAPDRYTLG